MHMSRTQASGFYGQRTGAHSAPMLPLWCRARGSGSLRRTLPGSLSRMRWPTQLLQLPQGGKRCPPPQTCRKPPHSSSPWPWPLRPCARKGQAGKGLLAKFLTVTKLTIARSPSTMPHWTPLDSYSYGGQRASWRVVRPLKRGARRRQTFFRACVCARVGHFAFATVAYPSHEAHIETQLTYSGDASYREVLCEA